MATKGKGYITFRDINSGTLPDGTLDKEIVELCAKENPALEDVLWKECRAGREDIVTLRTGIPEAVFRAFYEGVQGSKSSKKQVTNSCGTVSTAVRFDARLYDGAPDKAAFLMDEVEQHGESMGQGASTALFYGDVSTNPKGINGFSKTFGETATESTDEDEAAFYALNASRASGASAAKLRSVFVVGWGKKSAHGLYPQGSSVGLQKGKLEFPYLPDEEDSSKLLRTGIQEMNWDIGLNIRDFRYCGRIANIELDLGFGTTGNPDYVELLQRIVCRVKQGASVTTRLYMSRLTFELFSTHFYRKTMGNAVKYADLEQGVHGSLMGIKCGICDALNVNEAFVNPKA